MFRIAGLCVVSAISCNICLSQKPVIGMSPVPLWPQNGDTSAYPGKSVFLNLAKSEYIVKLDSPSDSDIRLLEIPTHRMVEANVSVVVTKRDDGLFNYVYQVSNGAGAATAIDSISIVLDQATQNTNASHPNWSPLVSRERPIGVPVNVYGTVRWQSVDGSDLKPGGDGSSFTVVSDLAPGFALMSFHGRSDVPEIDPLTMSKLPADVQSQLMICKAVGLDTKVRQVVAPRFLKQTPVSPVAANFLFGLNLLNRRDMVFGGSAKLDRFRQILGPVVEGVATVDAKQLEALKADATAEERTALSALQLTLGTLATSSPVTQPSQVAQ